MTELSRRPEQSTEELRRLDGSFGQEAHTILNSETLTPPLPPQTGGRGFVD